MSHKMVIIGGGPGGYVAAIRAAQLDNEVTLIERDELGGTCLNRGCISTKVMIESANAFWEAKNIHTFGIHVAEVTVDFPAVIKLKERRVTQLVNGVHYLMKKNKVRVVKGVGSIIDPKTVKIMESDEKIKADTIIIATGSSPSSIPLKGIVNEDFIDSNEALQMRQLPGSILIIGGGVIGIEFGQILHRMGVKVTVIEMMSRILPAEDAELALILEGILRNEGIEIFADATVKKIKSAKSGGKAVSFTTKHGDREKVVDKVLVAVGRSPETRHLGLEKLGINLDKKFIVVNEKMQTNISGIYAVGDVVGGIMLAHLASAEGKCAVENANGADAHIDYQAVPRCAYTSPEIACVGLTEAEAREKHGSNVIIGRFPLAGNSKSIILGETTGLVKVVAEDKYGEVLGLGIIAPHATELIGEGVLGIYLEATFKDFASAIRAHPTVSEAVMEAALNVEGRAIHI